MTDAFALRQPHRHVHRASKRDGLPLTRTGDIGDVRSCTIGGCSMNIGRSSAPGATQSTDGGASPGEGAELLVVQERSVTRYPLAQDGTLIIGRGSDCDIVVDDPAASRRHARIRVIGSAITIEDLESRNGTRVGARAATPGRPTRIVTGDTARIGETLLVLQRGSVRDSIGLGPSSGVVTARGVLADAGMRAVYDLVDQVGPSSLSVLILGETGVGKEVVAEAIHRASGLRSHRALVRVSCAALTEGLMESELFGHERGSFTGAFRDKVGLFETADGGTAFLDEVGELSLTAQAKLLRVIETREVMRVGALRPRHMDVRFIAATNRDLRAEIARGAFREDLYFRLNAATITVPPLRERPTEIEPLVAHFVDAFCHQLGCQAPPIGEAALVRLRGYAWPGNVRELRNVVEHALLRAQGRAVEVGDLPLPPIEAPLDTWARTRAATTARPPSPLPAGCKLTDAQYAERERILTALAVCHGNQTRAAEWLQMPRRTLVAKLATLAIPRPRVPRRERPV
jgi:two-component system, NtrC family, response regulator AtoC